jgi:hypothetical protein
VHERDRDLLKNKVTFVPAGEFEQAGTVEALLLSDGTILMNTQYVHHGASGATMGVYRKFLDAQVIVLHGTWKFIPDTETDNENA